jgi:hypothetical protein
MVSTYQVIWQGHHRIPRPWNDVEDESCEIRLRKSGEPKFGNEFLCIMFDEVAKCQFKKGDLVEADLGFHVVKLGNGSFRQAILVNDIKAVGKHG